LNREPKEFHDFSVALEVLSGRISRTISPNAIVNPSNKPMTPLYLFDSARYLHPITNEIKNAIYKNRLRDGLLIIHIAIKQTKSKMKRAMLVFLYFRIIREI